MREGTSPRVLPLTAQLNGAVLSALGTAVESHGDSGRKPLEIDLVLPNPPRLRVYVYSLVTGIGVRKSEFKILLRVPGQRVGEYGSFDQSGDRLVLAIGYYADLDVFVLWDASLHARFKNGGNLQVRDTLIYDAAALGRSSQTRRLSNGTREIVIATQSAGLLKAVDDRVSLTGGLEGGEWEN